MAKSWKRDEQNTIALSFYARGGMNTEWRGGSATFDPDGPGPAPVMTFDGTFGGSIMGEDQTTAGVDLMQGFLNLTYAREFGDTFSAGASAIFAIQRFEARGVSTSAPYTKTYVESYFTTGAPKEPKNLSGNGHEMSYGFGASVAVRWQPTEMFSIAAAYTTKMSISDLTHYSDLFAQGGGFDMPSTWTMHATSARS